jgi:flagellar assembly protein FliH
MTTSPRPRPEPALHEIPSGSPSEVQPFPYAEAAGMHDRADPQSQPEFHLAGMELAARQAGRKEGEMQARAQFEEQLERARQEIRAALENFAGEKRRYYQRIEEETVKLSLAIARKIVHREVHLDPLVMAGIAHAALQKLDASTSITLRVSPGNVVRWREYFKQYETFDGQLNIVEDSSLTPHSCVLETSLGSSEIGVEPQLQEIEKGFADLLAQRPK